MIQHPSRGMAETSACVKQLCLFTGSLWTQSPVELTPELKRACDELGQVKHIVSPNYEHTAFAKQVQAAKCGSEHGQLVWRMQYTNQRVSDTCFLHMRGSGKTHILMQPYTAARVSQTRSLRRGEQRSRV